MSNATILNLAERLANGEPVKMPLMKVKELGLLIDHTKALRNHCKN